MANDSMLPSIGNQELLSKIKLVDSKLQELTDLELTSFKTHGKFRFNSAYTAN